MKRWYLALFFTGIISFSMTAQDAYVHAVGLRLGPLAGVSYKRFIGVPSVVEGIFGYNYNHNTVSLTGLYEHHFFVNYKVNLFAGGGPTLAAKKDEFQLNMEAIAGVEYTFENFPLNFSLDYKPSYHILQNKLFFNEFALSIRYIL